MHYKRETASQIAERLRNGVPPVPVFSSDRLPVEGKTISSIGRSA